MIQPGQTYRRYDRTENATIRIRIESFTPGHNHAWVVDADTGKRARWVLIRNLHASRVTKTGQPRRTGYVLEQPTPGPKDQM